MEPEYPFDEGTGDFEGRAQADSPQYYRRATGIGDTVAEQRVYARDARRAVPRSQAPPPRSEEGMLGRLTRGVARIFAVLFLAAGIGLWMVYFGAMYILGLLGEPGMLAEDITNDLLFGLLSTLIALVLLMWSRADQAA